MATRTGSEPNPKREQQGNNKAYGNREFFATGKYLLVTMVSLRPTLGFTERKRLPCMLVGKFFPAQESKKQATRRCAQNQRKTLDALFLDGWRVTAAFVAARLLGASPRDKVRMRLLVTFSDSQLLSRGYLG